jgi:heat shock protein HslJ
MTLSTRLALSTAALLTAAACSSIDLSSTKPEDSALNRTLQAFHWDLSQAQDSQGQPLAVLNTRLPQGPLRLNFVAGASAAEQRLVIEKLCNTLSAGYSLQGDQIKVSRAAQTAMACPDAALMQLENAVAAQIGQASRVQLAQDAQAPRLQLQFQDGSRWQLVGTPTAATQYGSAAETLFLEVGPELKPCSHGVMRNAQCMQVREVKYSEAGLKTSVGEWSNFYGMIEGFSHQPGLRQVLRVKRYTLANPPADASRFVYQLDLRVETEKVSGQ